MSLGKWIFAGIGWASGGPIGALIGYYLGKKLFDDDGKRQRPHIADDLYEEPQPHRGPYRNTGTKADLTVSLMVLVAAVMKADGAVRQSELTYVKQFLIKNFEEKKAKELLAVLRDLTKQDINIFDVCEQIKYNTDYSTRYHMLDFLMGLAASDNDFSASEESLLSTMRGYLGINLGDYISMRARHYNGSHTGGHSRSNQASSTTQSGKDPYKVLGLTPSATDEEVKKAYRRFAMKYHPDKVEHLGEEMKKNAERQFKEIQDAYETIKTARGIK